MKKLLLFLFIICISFLGFTQTGIIVIKDATVIDVSTGKLINNQTVLIEGNKITSIGNKVAIPKTATIVEAKGKFLMPGLWDMHAHAFSDRRYEWLFPLLIVSGVTGVRDLATAVSFDSVHLIIKHVDEGNLVGPRFGAVTQKIFNGANIPGYPVMTVTNSNEARELVRLYKQQRMDFIKVYNQLSPEILRVIVDEAKLQGMPVAGHVPYAIGAAEASDLGFVSIEHNTDILMSCSGDETKLRAEMDTLPRSLATGAAPRVAIEFKAMQSFDEKKAIDLFKRFIRNGTSMCPTLVVPMRSLKTTDELALDDRLKYIPKNTRDQWYNQMNQRNLYNNRENIKLLLEKRISIVGLMQRTGVTILAGSDFPNPYIYPGFSLHDELELLVHGGLSPLQALQAATKNAVKFLHLEKELGTVEKGKLADLILLDENPLEKISNTRKINAVIANGRLFSRADLDKLLADVYNLQNK